MTLRFEWFTTKRLLLTFLFWAFLGPGDQGWPVEKKSDEKRESSQAASAAEKNPPVDRAASYYHFSLARGLEETGNFLSAVDEYKKAIQADPQSASLYVELSNAYLRHRQFGKAIQEA